MFSVLHSTFSLSPQTETNIFIYSVSEHTSRIFHLKKAPKNTVIVGRHVFVELRDYPAQSDGVIDYILDFDFDKGTQRSIEFQDASRWQYQNYGRLHVAEDRTNALHFEYRCSGKRLKEGKDYENGYYSLDVQTGNIKWVAERDKEDFVFRSADGRYVFFEGRDAPIHGHKLVSSPLDDHETEFSDPKRRNVKVITTFSKLSVLTGEVYELDQMSPCRRYAWVRCREPLMTTKVGAPGWANRYYLVDVSTGESRVLLKENVEKVIPGFISQIYWVGGGAKED